MKADFMKMPFSEDTFDAVYAIEATCHAPDAVCTLSDLGLTTKYIFMLASDDIFLIWTGGLLQGNLQGAKAWPVLCRLWVVHDWFIWFTKSSPSEN